MRNFPGRKAAASAALALLLAACGAPGIQRPAPEDAQGRLLEQIRNSTDPARLDKVWDLCSTIPDARPWLTLGYLYYQAGRYENSSACYGLALHYDPGNRTVRKWFLESGREPFAGQITFRWQPVDEADGYRFYFQLFEGAPWVRLNGGYSRQPQITVSGLEPGKTYACAVVSVQDWGGGDVKEGGRSEPDRKKAYPALISAESPVQARWKGAGNLKIQWKRSQELWVKAYHVSIVMPGNSKPTLLTREGPIKETHFQVEDLPQGARYKVIVSQVGEGNEQEVYGETEVEIPLK